MNAPGRSFLTARLALAAAALALLSGLAPGAAAQSNDGFYGAFRWTADVGAPRAAGMGGAFVAVADDSSAAFLNPAGLALLPKTELAGGLLARREGSTSRGDGLLARTGIGFVGGGGLITRRWALGGYVTEPHDSRIELAPNGPESGFLHTTVTDAGVAAAFTPRPGLHLGVRVNLTHLRLQARMDHRDASGAVDLEVGSATGADRVTAGIGILVEATPSVRLAATFTPGSTWSVGRVANNPRLGLALSDNPYEFRAPSVASAGISLRPAHQLLVSGQLDYVRYGELRSRLAIVTGAFSREDYKLDDALEGRLGGEISWPLGAVGLQLRAGAFHRAAGSLAYVGADPRERSQFPGAGQRFGGSLGASVVSRTGTRADVAVVLGGARSAFTGGIAVRF